MPADPPAIVDRIGVLRPLRHRDFRLMWTGLAVSMVGDGMYLIAVALLVLQDLDRSNGVLALVQGSVLLPQVVLIMGAGVLADRVDRRQLLIVADVIRLVAIGVMAILTIADLITVPILIGLALVYGAGQALFGPAFSSIVPTIVPGEILVEANSLGHFVRPVAMMLVGPLIGGVVVDVASTGAALIVDALTFGFSAIMILAMRTSAVVRDPGDVASPVDDLREGFRYVRSQRWLLIGMTGATVALLCTWGPWENLLPVVVESDLGGGGVELGLVYGFGGAGAVLAAIVMAQRGSLPRRPLTVLYLAWALAMFMTAGFGLVTSVWQAMGVSFVAEGSMTVLIVVWVTLVQRLVPSELLGRVFSLDWMISVAGAPVSFAIVGPLSEAIGHDTTLILAGVAGGLIVLGCLFLPGARTPETDGSIARLDAERSPVAT